MKHIIEEYGDMILGTVAALALTGLAMAVLQTGGPLHDAILKFAGTVC